jgi:CRISPR/Cas system-associated exonuclease Cas4 (RecB family)
LLSTARHKQQKQRQERGQGSLLLDTKIDEVAAGLTPEYARLLHNTSIENAKTIVDYILSMKIEVNLSDHYRQDVIKLLCKTLRYNNNSDKNEKKSFKDMSRVDVISFLESFLQGRMRF